MLKKKRFPEQVMKIWAAEICLAVCNLHEVGVVFRDLKPDNELLDRNGHVSTQLRGPIKRRNVLDAF
jgi:protein kinase A